MSTFELTKAQIDELSEIANISMGNAATNLSMMVNQRVDITTPVFKVINRSEALDDYDKSQARTIIKSVSTSSKHKGGKTKVEDLSLNELRDLADVLDI